MDDPLFMAVVTADPLALARVLGQSSERQRQDAMVAAVHWGDVECVLLLAPVCNVQAALAKLIGRNEVQPPGLRTRSEVVALLEAELMRRQLAERDAPESTRARL